MSLTPKRASIVVSIFSMLVVSVLRRALGLFSISILARVLTPIEVGTYAFMQMTGQTFAGILRMGVDAGVHVSVSRRVSDTQAQGDLLGCGLVVIGAIALTGGALMVALAEPIARDLFGAPDLAPYVTVAAVFFAGQFLSQGAYAGFAGLGRFMEYTYLSTAISIATVVSTILGGLTFGVDGAVWAFAAVTLAGALVYGWGLIQATRAADVRIRPNLCRDHLHAILRIGMPFYLAGIFLMPVEFLSQGLVSRLGGVETLAELRVILSLMAIVQLIPQAISGPILSLFSEREGRQAGAGVVLALEHMRWLWIFALLSGAALMVVWPAAIAVLFGSGFPGAATIGQMAIAAFVPTIVGTALTSGILVAGRPLPLVLVGIVQAGVMFGAAQALIPRIGLPGYFVAQTAAGIAAVILWLLVLGWQTRTAPLRSWMAPLLLATVALYAALIVDARIDETATERSLVSLFGLPAFLAAIAYAALSRAERILLVTRLGTTLAAGRVQLASWWRRRRGTS